MNIWPTIFSIRVLRRTSRHQSAGNGFRIKFNFAPEEGQKKIRRLRYARSRNCPIEKVPLESSRSSGLFFDHSNRISVLTTASSSWKSTPQIVPPGRTVDYKRYFWFLECWKKKIFPHQHTIFQTIEILSFRNSCIYRYWYNEAYDAFRK